MKVSEKENIKNVINNTSSKKNAFEVASWFANSMEGQSYISDLIDKDSYLLEEHLEDLSISSEQSQRIFSKIESKIKKPTLKPLLFKVVAILLPFVLFLSIGISLNRQVSLFGKSDYSEIYVPKGEIMRIIFQDGSEAYLNSDTKLKYPNKFGLKNRKVFLDGEAYFNVSSNKRRPFIVETLKNKISVLGTSFNVDAYTTEDRIEVVLDEGKIVFDSGENSYIILPGQKITFKQSDGSTAIKNLKNSIKESSWKDNIIHFSNTPLDEVVKTLDRRYNVKFIINNPDALKYTYTLISKQTTIENILNELEKIAPVRFDIKEDQINVGL